VGDLAYNGATTKYLHTLMFHDIEMHERAIKIAIPLCLLKNEGWEAMNKSDLTFRVQGHQKRKN
jgi:hypothetical protein